MILLACIVVVVLVSMCVLIFVGTSCVVRGIE